MRSGKFRSGYPKCISASNAGLMGFPCINSGSEFPVSALYFNKMGLHSFKLTLLSEIIADGVKTTSRWIKLEMRQ